MTGAEMRAWRERLGYTRRGAADALGLSESQLADYEAGTKRGTARPALIPRHVALACAAVALGLREP